MHMLITIFNYLSAFGEILYYLPYKQESWSNYVYYTNHYSEYFMDYTMMETSVQPRLDSH